MGIFGVFAKVNKMNKEIEQNKDKYKDDLFTVVITSSLDDRKKSRAASIVKTWLGGSSSDIKELMNGSVPIEVRKHLSYEKAYKAIFNLKDEDIDAELVNETANGSSAAVVAEPYDVSEVPEENAPAADDASQLVQAGPDEVQVEKATGQQVQAVLAAAKAELEKVQAEKAAAEQTQAELAAAKAELEKAQTEKAAAEQVQAELAAVKAELEKVQAEKAAAQQARAELAAAKAELEKVQAEKAAAQQAQAELAAAKAELKAKAEALSPQEQIASLGDSPNDYDYYENYAISKDGEKLVVFGNDEIEKMQFRERSFEKVVILDGVKSIGRGAFSNCQELTEVIIADSVTEVKNAFNGCGALEKVTMPAGLKTIGYSFDKLESIDLSRCSKLKNVDLGAFSNVKNILLPDVVERIIGHNWGIREIKLPPSFKKIGEETLKCYRIYCYSRNVESPVNLITCCANLYLPQDMIKSFIDLLQIEDDVTKITEESNGWLVKCRCSRHCELKCTIRPIPEEKLYVYDD